MTRPKNKQEIEQPMVLSGSSEALEKRALTQSIQALQWRVTTLDDTIDATRQSLLLFEASYQQTMEPFSDKLIQLSKVLRRLKAPRCRGDRRSPTLTCNIEINRRSPTSPCNMEGDQPVAPTEHDQKENTEIPHIRDLFRSLARQHHPDLATNEDDRIMRSHVMARVNDAYKQRDLTRLLQIQDRMASVNLDGDLDHLRSRHAHLQDIETQLLQEMETLRQCPIALLQDKITEANQRGFNLLPLIQEDMQQEFQQRLPLIQAAAYELEQAVQKTSNQQPADLLQKSYINHRILDKLLDLTNTDQNTILLLIMAHFFNISPDVLGGLSHYDDIEMRLRAASSSRTSLAACLVDAEAWVSFDAIKHHRIRTGLMNRDPAIAATMPHFVAHSDSAVMVRRILSIIGDVHPCTRCKRNVFTIPLMLLSGLDSLRALACPLCGQWVHFYWLPCGDDIASVFGPMYLQHGLLHEIPIFFGDILISIQLTPTQHTRWNVAQLLDMVVHHVFVRNNVEIKRDAVVIMSNNNVIHQNIPLKKFNRFDLVFSTTHGIHISTLIQNVKENIASRYTR